MTTEGQHGPLLDNLRDRLAWEVAAARSANSEGVAIRWCDLVTECGKRARGECYCPSAVEFARRDTHLRNARNAKNAILDILTYLDSRP